MYRISAYLCDYPRCLHAPLYHSGQYKAPWYLQLHSLRYHSIHLFHYSTIYPDRLIKRKIRVYYHALNVLIIFEHFLHLPMVLFKTLRPKEFSSTVWFKVSIFIKLFPIVLFIASIPSSFSFASTMDSLKSPFIVKEKMNRHFHEWLCLSFNLPISSSSSSTSRIVCPAVFFNIFKSRSFLFAVLFNLLTIPFPE